MSLRYKGAVISATPPTTTGGPSGTAPGSWTLQQQLQAQSAGTWPSQPLPAYIEEVFSTWLYTGNGSTQTITNGIDLAGKGGMVWTKSRSSGIFSHALYDTARGINNWLASDSNGAQATLSGVSAFNSDGFSVGSANPSNASAETYVSWTFRKQPKFFDVVTYTGNGANRTIAHNLGSVPGCIIVKRTNTTGAWAVYHRSLANTDYLVLNTTAASATGATYWNSTTATSTDFSLGTATDVNASGGTYVAYLFAHNAGGFGAAGTDNVISCGSFTTDGSGFVPDVNLGYEPQWVLIKQTNAANNWYLLDTMRNWSYTDTNWLAANLSNAEAAWGAPYSGSPTPTGFKGNISSGVNNGTFIYIAIRRGPMKTPTSGTSVFGLNARTGTGANATVTGSAGVSDAVLIKNRGSAVGDLFASRLTGTGYLETSSTAAEVAAGTTILQANPWDVMDGVKVGTTSTITNASSNTYINYLFDRAPGFFDEVCYTGNGASSRSVAHNLGAPPNLMIIKSRSAATAWPVSVTTGSYYAYFSNLASNTNADLGQGVTTFLNGSATTFNAGEGSWAFQINVNGNTYVAYLFASCPGVSKVGSYTGTGATQTISCGFTGGARFVLIKRTNSTGDWYVWDTARGMTSSTDPYLLLNSAAAETTGTDYVETSSTGFTITSTAPAGINANGGTYIFLAIA